MIALPRPFRPLAPRWYTGLPDAHGVQDLAWLRRTGEPMTAEHWQSRMSRIMGAWIGAPGRGGAPLLVLFNGRDLDASFVLPQGQWVAELDSTQADGRSGWRQADQPVGAPFVLASRSVMLLRDETGPTAPARSPRQGPDHHAI